MRYLSARAVDTIEYTRQLATLRNPHPLQTAVWGDLKSRWGWSSHPILFERSGSVIAAAMVLKRPFPYTPFSFLYIPKGVMLDYANDEVRTAVFNHLPTIGREHRALFIKIDPDVMQATGADEPIIDPLGESFVRELTEKGWRYSAEQIQFRNTVTLDLTQNEEALMTAMKSKTRYNIRLAEQKEVTVRVGSRNDFDAIADLYVHTGTRNQFGLRPRPYYLDVWETFNAADMLHPLIAEYKGELLAAVMLVHYGDLCLYMYGASSDIERNRMPTYLLQWEAIKWAKARGYKTYDMWGAPDVFDESDTLWGVWRFKQGFNGTVRRHIGAWDYPLYPRLYTLYADLLPKYRNWLRGKNEG